MRYFPAFVDLEDAPVLVVGGGDVAARKIALLRQAGARITVVAPHIGTTVESLVAQGVVWVRRRFEPPDVRDMRLVIAATGDRGVNADVSAAARNANVPANVVDDAGLSSFIVPAIVDRGALVVAVSSGGAAPMLAMRLRERIEAMLDETWGRLALLADRWRARIRAALPDMGVRMRFYDWMLDGPVAAAVRAGRECDAARLIEARLAPAPAAPSGKVMLVGAGPGDPGLLTLRALRALQQADVILADRLVSKEILRLARRDAEIIDVGKEPGGRAGRQDAINRLLVVHARRGRSVVRLKGGDPFVFGRGGEELEFLERHRIAFEVVPGVTAAIACAAYAGIPLTHREHSRGLQLVTAHCRESLDDVDWPGLARPGQTLAFYMGVSELAAVRDHLIASGMPPATPAALVQNGTHARQRVVVTELVTLADAARRQEIVAPAMLFVGEVARFAARFAWFGNAPILDSCRSPQAAVYDTA